MRWLAGVLMITAAVLAVAGALACRQTLGIDQYFNAPADAGPSMSACGLPYRTMECASCVSTGCCAESRACAGDLACAAFMQCVDGCGPEDWTCRAKCWADHRPGSPQTTDAAAAGAFVPLAACRVAKCANECGLSCGYPLALGLRPDAAVACAHCMITTGSCAAERACGASLECSSHAVCSANCFGNHDCACEPSTDAGKSLWYPAATDFFRCGAACEIGSNWECVGHPSGGSPASNGSTLMTSVIDPLSVQGLSGADVYACYGWDWGCDAGPYARGMTDAGGSVVLPVAPSPVGRGLDANNYLQVTLNGEAPSLYYWGFNVSNPPPQGFTIPLASQAEWQQIIGPSVPLDPSRGMVLFYVDDCTPIINWQAAGVQVSLDVKDKFISEYYFSQGGSPSFVATETGGTGGIGGPSGGFVNVPQGSVTLTAVPRAIGIPSSHATVWVRAGAVTIANLMPNQ